MSLVPRPHHWRSNPDQVSLRVSPSPAAAPQKGIADLRFHHGGSAGLSPQARSRPLSRVRDLSSQFSEPLGVGEGDPVPKGHWHLKPSASAIPPTRPNDAQGLSRWGGPAPIASGPRNTRGPATAPMLDSPAVPGGRRVTSADTMEKPPAGEESGRRSGGFRSLALPGSSACWNSVGDTVRRVFGGSHRPRQSKSGVTSQRGLSDGARPLPGVVSLAPNDYVITLGASDFERERGPDLTADTFAKTFDRIHSTSRAGRPTVSGSPVRAGRESARGPYRARNRCESDADPARLHVVHPAGIEPGVPAEPGASDRPTELPRTQGTTGRRVLRRPVQPPPGGSARAGAPDAPWARTP